MTASAAQTCQHVVGATCAHASQQICDRSTGGTKAGQFRHQTGLFGPANAVDESSASIVIGLPI